VVIVARSSENSREQARCREIVVIVARSSENSREQARCREIVVRRP